MEELSVWLYGVRVALIEQDRGRLRLSYTEEALGRFPLGTPLLSLSLPLTPDRYPQGVVRAYLDGLLPEGAARRAVAQDFDLAASDTYGLIAALGRECAGAVVIQPASYPPPSPPTIQTAEPLSESEIAALVANLRSAPLGVGQRVRISLAGMQEKLVLTRMSDGSWGRPVEGTPSTHILKPELAEYPRTVENEAFCMRVAGKIGVRTASVETTTIARRSLLVVERYDRLVDPDGSVERIHQEDLCQALGLQPEQKYEEDGGPSLRRVADVYQSAAAPGAVEALLQATTVNVLIGNGDAHAKNYSLLHQQSGALTVAPLYDLLSTLHYGDDRLAMYVDGVQRTSRVTTDRILNEATRWGLSKGRATEVVDDILARAPEAIDAARQETKSVPAALVELVRSQLRTLRGSA